MKFINERVSNNKEVLYQLKRIEKRLGDLVYDVSYYTGNKHTHQLFCEYKNDKRHKIENILKNISNKLINNNLFLTYDFSYRGLGLYIKDILSHRYVPTRFVYHATLKENVESIKELGIIPHYSTNYNEAPIGHPDLIFATEIFNKNWGNSVFEIDTKGLKNKWWKDLNFDPRFTSGFMTNEAIPPTHIRYVEKESDTLKSWN